MIEKREKRTQVADLFGFRNCLILTLKETWGAQFMKLETVLKYDCF